MANCSTCGTPLPESFYGYTCNACKLIELQKNQNNYSSYSGGGGSDPRMFWFFVGIFLLVDFCLNHWPLMILWFYTKIIWCVLIGWWTGTCII